MSDKALGDLFKITGRCTHGNCPWCGGMAHIAQLRGLEAEVGNELALQWACPECGSRGPLYRSADMSSTPPNPLNTPFFPHSFIAAWSFWQVFAPATADRCGVELVSYGPEEGA